MIRSIRPTPLRLSLLAALATLALLLVVFAAYTAYAQGQEVTSTRDATGENPPRSRPTSRSRPNTIRSGSPGRRQRTRPSPTTRSCAATGARTMSASFT